MKRATARLALAVLLGAATASAAQTLHDSVRAAVRSHPRLSIFDDVQCSLAGDVVTLRGKVTLAEKKSEVERRLLEVPGVREVRNAIEVLPPSPADDALRRRVARAIYGNSAFWRYAAMPQPPIHIVIEDGDVVLTGEVPTDGERVLAGSLAAGQGARSVTNALTVTSR